MPRVPTIALFVAATSLLGACASPRPAVSRRTTLTSAELQTGYREAEAAAEDVALGKYTDALARADNAVRLAPQNPWALYNRAAALHHLGRSEDAVAAYQNAEVQFGEDRWGRSLAIYGRARAFDDIGRCDEAKRAYDEFASLVRSNDARAADMALSYASQCRATEAPPSVEAPLVTEMTTALRSGNYALVLELKDKLPPTAGANPWIDYNAGAAFAGLGKTDEAIAAFERAERQFGEGDRWGRSVAIWGRARALDSAGRCAEAAQAVEDYARVVGGSDPRTLRVATSYASSCP